ncbi:MAG TPA: MFS transporter [Humisphaera sp.]|jgi:sugar phosphate permease|nr:MFS transporter [Humisphaera sp.]
MTTTTVPSSGARTVPGRTRRFLLVLPLAFVTYSLAYLDRVNIGFGEAGGMSKTLNLRGDQFAFFSASFFFGYVLFQIPGASYAAKHSSRKLLFVALILWAAIATLTGLLTNYWLLLIDRFLLGVVEGVVLPALLVYLTHWFNRRERSLANSLLIQGNPVTVAWASVVSGYLVQYFSSHPIFGLAGWQTMLVAEGLPTLLWAGIWWKAARDYPRESKHLTREQIHAIETSLEEEQRNVKHVKDFRAAARDPQVIILCLQYLTWSIGIYGLTMWLPVILKSGSSAGVAKVGLLNAIPFVIGAITMAAVSWASDRLQTRKVFVWPFMFLGAVAFGVSYWAGQTHFWIGFVGLIVAAVCMYAPYGPFWALVPEMVSRNVAAESMALINTLGAAGGFFGTYFVKYLRDHVGGYGASFIFLSVALAASGVLTLLVRPRVNSPVLT